MNFFNTKNGRIVKTVLAVVLAIATVAGAAALIATVANKKDDGLKKISPTFEVGGLTESGKYKETKLSLYTKESFGCQGLKITPDFDAKANYQIYYYDEVDNFISASEVYTEGVTAEVPASAIKARLVITPIWEKGTEDKDKELNIFDALIYGGKITIKVADKQYETAIEKIEGSGNLVVSLENAYVYQGYVKSDTSPSFWSNAINVNGIDKVVVCVDTTDLDGTKLTMQSSQIPKVQYLADSETAATEISYSNMEIFGVKDGNTYFILDVSSFSTIRFSCSSVSYDVFAVYEC